MSLDLLLGHAPGRLIKSNSLEGDPWQFKVDPVPWSRIRDWNCIACGECCKHFSVPITQEEWRTIAELYGLGLTTVVNRQPHLRSTISGRCIFQRWIQGRWLCTIQTVKPLVCKLWPFRIYDHPKHGDPELASFTYRRRQIFVYCDQRCSGVSPGSPSPHLVSSVVPEFAAIALGEKVPQTFSTARTRPSTRIPPFESLDRLTELPRLTLGTLV